MISIHRDKDHLGLVAVVFTGKNVAKIDINSATNHVHLTQMIGASAQALNLDWLDSVEEFDRLYRALITLSRERKRRINSIKIEDAKISSNDFWPIWQRLISDGILTMDEIFWLDNFWRESKLGEKI
jgi:hypothetical protein